MKSFRIFLFVTAFVISAYSKADYCIVYHKTSQSIDDNFIKDVFLGSTTHWEDGSRILPAHIAYTTIPGKEFLTEALGMGPQQFKTHWLKKLFAGRGHPPRMFPTDKEVFNFLSSYKNAIAIVEKVPKVMPEDLDNSCRK